MEDYYKKIREISGASVEAPGTDGFCDGRCCGGEELQSKAEAVILKKIMENVEVANYSEKKRLAQDRSGWRIPSNQSADLMVMRINYVKINFRYV